MHHKITGDQFIIKVSCKARSGIIAEVARYLSEKGCYISELSQYDDSSSGLFFLRAVCYVESGSCILNDIREGFAVVADLFGMSFDFFDAGVPTKVLLMVSKFDHCLDDLLTRHRKGEMHMQITAVVSNHLDLRPMAEREGIRFIYLPISKENKLAQERELLKVVEETGTELVVLARYMQILSNGLCAKLRGKAINIHHSFLPGFKGAKPYHQAYERGVKLIGATAHYVTSDLDEGPIIEQSVQAVNHTHSPADLVTVGRNTEVEALQRAVKLHVQHRIFLDGNKTVIFN